MGGQVIQIPTTILAQASALQSVVVRQSTGNNNQSVLLRGGDTLDVIRYITCLQITSNADYIGDGHVIGDHFGGKRGLFLRIFFILHFALE